MATSCRTVSAAEYVAEARRLAPDLHLDRRRAHVTEDANHAEGGEREHEDDPAAARAPGGSPAVVILEHRGGDAPSGLLLPHGQGNGEDGAHRAHDDGRG